MARRPRLAHAAALVLALSACGLGEGFGRVRGKITFEAGSGVGRAGEVRVVARGSMRSMEGAAHAFPAHASGAYEAQFGWGGMGLFRSSQPREVFVRFLPAAGPACTVAVQLGEDVRELACGVERACVPLDVTFLPPEPSGPPCRVSSPAAPARVVE